MSHSLQCTGLQVFSLASREIIRFFRQRNRVIGALATPLIFWLILGLGFSPSFAPAGATDRVSYFAYFFPGALVLIVFFTAIFATISVIEDRREGFLQGVLVSPASASAIALGKVIGGTAIASIQGIIFLLLAPMAGFSFTPLSAVMVLSALLVSGMGLTSFGLIIAWPMDSTQGFHALMNVFLVPLWILSGAMFPMQGNAILETIARFNPLAYLVDAVRLALAGVPGPYAFNMAVSLLFSAAFLTACIMLVKRKRHLS